MNDFHPNQRSDLADLRGLLTAIIARRWWIIGSVLISTGIFTAVAFLSTPVYRSSIVVAPATANRSNLTESLGSLGESSSLVSLLGLGMSGNDTAIQAALAVLRSREFTESFISDEHLMPLLFSGKWDEARGTWRVVDAKVPTLAKGFAYFDDNIRSIDENKKTGLITLQIEWSERTFAAAWANELMKRLNNEMRARAIASADASLSYLEKELQSTATVETRDAISRLIEAQVKQRMLANVTPEFVFQVVDPALPADSDDPIRPKKSLLLLLGPLVGLVVGTVAAVISRVYGDVA